MVVALQDIIKNGEYKGSEDLHKERNDGIVKFHRVNHNVDLDGKEYKTSILIGEDKNGNKFYDLDTDNRQKKEAPRVPVEQIQAKGTSNSAKKATKNIITQNFEEVNIFFED